MAYACRIEADSCTRPDEIAPDGCRLTTFVVTFPRFILAEVNTHRMLSRNSASSRAVPIQKKIASIEDDPVCPIFWGKNQKGMQAREELSRDAIKSAHCEWLLARDEAIDSAKKMLEIGVHKQIVNRLLEPWMWHTAIISGTDWDNFFHLRNHPDAQPEFQHFAKMMEEQYRASEPKLLEPGMWHLPFTTFEERLEYGADVAPDCAPDEYLMETDGASYTLSKLNDFDMGYTPYWNEVCPLIRIATGRITRVSYETHDGKRNAHLDEELCTRIISSGHMSPTEDCAMAMSANVRRGNFRGFFQFRKCLPNEAVFPRATP